MYDRVLIPLDGSTMSETAVDFVARLPVQTVSLLRVEPNYQVLQPGPLENFRPDWRDVVIAQREDEMQPVAERLRERGKEVEIALRFGDPAEEIMAAAKDVDLIVMTTRGRGAAGRALFGSVADRVSRHGTAPTLLLRGGQLPTGTGPLERIVVPLDGSAVAEEALPAAAHLARELDVPVRLVHVMEVDQEHIVAPPGAGLAWGMVVVGTEPDPGALDQEQRANQYLTARVERLTAAEITASAVVEAGGPAAVLLDLVTPGDLLVMTTHGHGGVQRWLLGSVAEKLVREAVAPVLLVRAGSTAATD